MYICHIVRFSLLFWTGVKTGVRWHGAARNFKLSSEFLLEYWRIVGEVYHIAWVCERLDTFLWCALIWDDFIEKLLRNRQLKMPCQSRVSQPEYAGARLYGQIWQRRNIPLLAREGLISLVGQNVFVKNIYQANLLIGYQLFLYVSVKF